MFYNVFSFFYSFVYKFRKQGFTLAEALIITVMTGVCLLPILGTMQNAQVRTEKFDHQSKMQQYARSRLNAEIANAAFDHKSINIDDEYHYIVFFDESGDQDEAKKLELVKTSINLEDFKNLNQKVIKDHWPEEACRLFGITKSGNGKTPYLKVIHAYKTSVETKDNPELAFVNTDSNSEEQVETPKALLGIVVKTSLLESDDNTYNDKGYLQIVNPDDATKYVSDETTQVVPVTLFAFANLPLVSDEMIWLADALNCKIYGIDPVSKVLGKTIDLPKNGSSNSVGTVDDNYRPWHLAVHPSLKLLACSTKKHLYLINIDKKSGNFGDYSESHTFQSEVNVNGGITFRPDGRYLFVCPELVSGNDKLTTYKVNYHIESDKIVWKPKDTVASEPNFIVKNRNGSIQNSQEIVAVLAANDGYLYVARKDKDYGVIRFPMYSPDIEKNVTWAGEKIVSSSNGIDGDILSIDVSPDGTRLAVVASGSENLFIYDTRDKKQILKKKITDVSGVTNFKPNNVVFTAISNSTQSDIIDDKNLNLTITNKETGKENVANVFYVEKTATGNELKKLRNIKYQDNKGSNFAVNSADNTSVIITDQEKDQIYFETVGTDNNSEDLLNIEGSVFQYSRSQENSMNCSSIVAPKRDLLAIGDETNLKLLDLNTFKLIEDYEYTTTNSLRGLSFNPNGDLLLGYYGTTRYGYSRFHIGDLNFCESDTGIANSKKYVFDDSIPNMVFSLEDDGSSQNAFGNVTNNPSKYWNTSDSAYDRYDFDLDRSWKRFDMIGMPNGGAMVLYGKDDGSSMVEWIGRRSWAQDEQKNKYRLFARWTNIKTSSSENTIPNYDLSDVSKLEVDQDSGIVVIESYHELPAGYSVKTVSLKTGNAADSSGTVEWEEDSRYVTPVIFKKESGKFKMYDYAEPIDLEPNKTYLDVDINWLKHGGYIPTSGYYIGFWNGDAVSDTKDKGAIAYERVTSNYYLSNYLYSGNQSMLFSNILSNDLDSPDSNFIGNSKRKYAIYFKLGKNHLNTDFPPLYAERLAISPDCGTLAFLSRYGNNGNSGEDAIPVLRLYDFRNFNYGMETQIEGMLVDYRKPFQSGAWNGSVVEPTNHWPNEDNARFFKEVSPLSHFKNDQLNKFTLATTKNDSWASFNSYPANYRFLDGETDFMQKGRANKRFWGYLRPELDYTYMQMYFTDEPRIFVNNSFVYGETEKGTTHFLQDSLPVALSSFSCSLFQIDHASNEGGMDLSVFFNKNGNSACSTSNINSETISGKTGIISQYYSYNTSNNNGWVSLTSPETYILNNSPTFMYSYKVLNGDTKIDMDYANMVFSRDRANPVLYLKGRVLLFALYKNKIAKLSPGGEGNTSKSVVVSTDGQKLVFSKGNYLNVFNISNFDENSFLNENVTIATSPNLVTDRYLGKMVRINMNASATYLATKPLNSFNSAKTGGEYKLVATNSFSISANAAAVASGGIYLVKSGSKDLGFFKPFDNVFEVKEEALQSNSNYAAITTYNNYLYIFGNYGQSDEPCSARVQSYNVNSEDTMTSIDDASYSDSEYDKAYQVSMGVPDSGNNSKPTNFGLSGYGDIDVYITSSNISRVVHAFVKNSYDYATYTCGSDRYIGLGFDLPLTVNHIVIDNNENSDSVRDFELKGSIHDNFANSVSLVNKTDIPKASAQGFNTVTEGAYKRFRVYLNSGKNVSLIQLWRKGVKRLTPPLNCSTTEFSSLNNQNLIWNRPNGEKTYMLWATNSNDKSLKDVYLHNDTDGNNWFKTSSYYWETNEAKPWIVVSLSKPEAVCALRYANAKYINNKTKAKNVRLYGSNDVLPNNFTSPFVGPGKHKVHWEAIRFTNNRQDYSAPLVHITGADNRYVEETFVTAEIKKPKKFKNYLFIVDSKIKNNQPLKMIGFELFSTYSEEEETANQDYMTPLTKDDLGLVKLGKMAACSTPYGLVCAGGASGSTASSTAILYWPHGINKYDGQYYEYGISRSLPDLNCARYNHALVWHKGKIYAIGGLKDSSYFAKNEGSGTSEKAFIECLDYNSGNMQWNNAGLSSYTLPVGCSFGTDILRESHGACSFGDEIFIFGGNTNEDDTSRAAYAWNPETKVMRELTPLPSVLIPCCAVPFGSKIYVMGMNSGKFIIYEYTP